MTEIAVAAKVDMLTDYLAGETLYVQAVDTVWLGSEVFVSELPNPPIGSAPVLTGTTVVQNGASAELHADPGPFILVGIPALTFVVALIVCIDGGGGPSTDRILAWLDRRADTTPLTFEATGAAYGVTFPQGYVARIG